jgi:hypothetical protein
MHLIVKLQYLSALGEDADDCVFEFVVGRVVVWIEHGDAEGHTGEDAVVGDVLFC